MRVNLLGPFLGTKACLPLLRASGAGSIVNVGSIDSVRATALTAAYTATKHAITGLTKSLSLDGRPHGIACGQIDIGNAATEMTEAMAEGAPQPDGSVRPEPRMDVADPARCIRYLASLPLDANVLTMTVMATGMPYVGRG